MNKGTALTFRVAIVLVQILAVTVAGIRPAAAASAGVSSRYEPLLAQVVEYEKLNPTPGVEPVPYVVSDLEQVLGSGSGRSSVTADCSGIKIAAGESVCSEFTTQQNVTDSVTGNTFSKDCPIELIYGSVPKLLSGGDNNEDGRIDLYGSYTLGARSSSAGVVAYAGGSVLGTRSGKPEWPSMAFMNHMNTPSVEEINGTLRPGDDIHESTDILKPPDAGKNDAARRAQEALEKEPTEIAYTLGVSGGNAEMVRENDDAHLATDPCENECTSSPRDCLADKDCPTIVASANDSNDIAYSFMTPDPEKLAARPSSESTTCPQGDGVPDKMACLNTAGIISAPIARLKGLIKNADCVINNDCVTNAHVYVYMDSVTGLNSGCPEEPCPDYSLDTRIASRMPPDASSNCSSYGTGQNNACWEDTWMTTPGICTVCGKAVGCTLVWKNWVKDNFDMMKLELPPCDTTINPYCEWEAYWAAVKKQSESI